MRKSAGLSRALKPVGVCAVALGLAVAGLGVGAGVAGASHSKHKALGIVPPKPITNFEGYVGGHGKAKHNLSPVVVGIVNQETSTHAIAPIWTTGAELAEKYVNQHTGGVDGHPLKLVLCKVPTTVSAATTCGQEFANNSKIDAIASGPLDVGNTAFESALGAAKKPLFFGVSLSTVDEKYPYGFILFGTTAEVETPMATAAKTYMHVKSVSLVYPATIPGNVFQATVIDDSLKYDGINTVYKVGFTTSETNLSAPFEAAHVGQTTLFIFENSGGPACADAYLTLKSLGLATKTKVLVNIPCATPTVAKADGGALPHDWYYLTADPMPGANTADLNAITKVAAKYGEAAKTGDAWTDNAFGEVLTIAKLDTQILKSHKKITPEAVFKAMRAFHGPVVYGGPHIHCGTFKGTPATCSDLDRFFENTAPTVMKPLFTNKWIPGPKGFKVPATS